MQNLTIIKIHKIWHNMSNDLMQKLAISKAIMDKHNQIKRGQATEPIVGIDRPELQDFTPPTANYNIPQEMIAENFQTPISSPPKPVTKDLIMSSKLPDEIKKLMIENPITPSSPMMNNTSVLSDELIEKATKLMGTNKPELQPYKTISNTLPKQSNSDLKNMLREVVEEVLRENGLLVESSNKTDEILSLRVGQHIFEGKIHKIKKIK